MKNMTFVAIFLILGCMMTPIMALAEDDSSVGVSLWAEGDPGVWGDPMEEGSAAESDWYGGMPENEPSANAIIAAGGDEDTGSFD
jgi:hypothetical protein